MTGALWYAVVDLLCRREERKVVLTLTDGDPDDWESAAEIITTASSDGIEMIGIGIQKDASGCSRLPFRSQTSATSRETPGISLVVIDLPHDLGGPYSCVEYTEFRYDHEIGDFYVDWLSPQDMSADSRRTAPHKRL